MKTGAVIYAERVPKMKAFYTPNDPQYPQQWHLTKIQASQAWDIYNANPNNSDVVLAVVDDAVKLAHEDLQANIWVNPGEIPNNGIDDDNNGYIDDINGYDVAMNDPDPNPPSNATNSYFMHGTHVAGIAAAVSNNATGISSISGAGQNKVKIMAVKTAIDTSAGGALQATFEGIQYAIAAGADIINMSFGSYVYSYTYQNLFITAHSLGITLVAAAGNDAWEAYMFPASYLYVVGVGATDSADMKATFSNFGDQIDVMAPGVGIVSTLPVGDNSYGSLSGTSMASPLVAGLAGLILSYDSTLMPAQIEKLIEENCDDIYSLNALPPLHKQLGAGRINAYKVMQAMQSGDVPPDEDLTATNIFSSEPGFQAWGLVWGDYNNDGYLDYAVMGAYPGQALAVTRIYRNNGNNTFTNINANIVSVCGGNLAWGDYDRDGNLDLAISGFGWQGVGIKNKIYHNDGNDVFTDISASLPATSYGSVAWGDYDNDGDLDLAISNFNSGGSTKIFKNDSGIFIDSGIEFPIEAYSISWGDYNNDGKLDLALAGRQVTINLVKIYRNDGNGAFTDVLANIPTVSDYYCSAAWGDYDNDGDLDLLLSLSETTPPMCLWGLTRLYRNDNGVFNYTDVELPGGGGGGHSVWGDYNNDGYLDIATCGYTSEYNSIYYRIFQEIRVYKNNQNGTFTQDTGSEFDRVAGGRIAFGDYDNDGRLDLLIVAWAYRATWSTTMGGLYTPWEYVRLYKNNFLNNNVVPNQPLALSANVSGDEVTLSWQKSTDAQTPQNGLSYNIYMGTTPSSVDKVSPMSELSNGWRKIVKMGPQQGSQSLNTVSYTVKDLACGTTYYWGVQAIDTAFAGSAFATGMPFTTEPCPGSAYSISGTVYKQGGGTLQGATVTLSTGQTITTNTSGQYSFDNIASSWNGTISASATGYNVVAVAPFMVLPLTSNQTQNFNATPLTFTISGTITNLTTCNTYPVTVTAAGSGSFQTYTTSASSGSYTINDVPYGWTGTLSISSPAYTFTAVAPVFNGGPVTGSVTQNYTATLNTYNFSGNIVGLVPGINATVTVTPTCSNVCGLYQTPVAIVLPMGVSTYSFTVPYGWEGSITATSPAYTLTAVAPVFNGGPVTAAVTQDFTAALNTYTITGTINGLISGNTYPVTITAAGTGGSANFSATTTNLSYSIPNIPYGWQGNITATSAAYDFTPALISIPAVTANLTSQDFVAALKTFSVSGDILNIIPGTNYPITITANCSNTLAPWYSSITNINASSGHYNFTLPYGWKGTLSINTPAYYLKEDPSVTFQSPVTSNQTQNYRVTKLKEFNVTGTITFDLNQNTNFPITIKAACSNSKEPWYKNVTTNVTAGYYAMKLPYGWEGALVPTSQAYILTEDPAVTFNSPVFTDQVQNYLAKIKMFAISGHTYLGGLANKPIAGVSLQAKGLGAWAGYSTLATSNIEGDYVLDVPYSWQGTIKPSKDGYTFMPTSRSYNNVIANYTTQDYLGTATGPAPVTYTISGYVRTQAGQGINQVIIKDATAVLTYTNAQGFYTVSKPKGWSGTVTPVKQGYKFNPANRSYTNLSSNQSNQNYTGKQ